MKRVAFHTFGCKLNFAETGALAQQFQQHGYSIVNINDSADIVVINSCCVTHHAERECRQIIRRTRRSLPQAQIVVIGCYAQCFPDTLRTLPGVSLVLGNIEKFSILNYLENDSLRSAHQNVVSIDRSIIHPASSLGYKERTRVFIKVQEGCDYHCTYCIVPVARGNSRSVPKEIISQQVKDAVVQGYKEIVLTGVNVGDYGKPYGETLLSLLQTLVTIEGLERLRISSIEPNLLTDELLAFWFSEQKLCKHWHIPLQSGSNSILRQMGRRYTRELFEERVLTIKAHYPTAAIGVDVIVGFPGETESLFYETYQFIEQLPISYLHVFSYSNRPTTVASTFSQNVSTFSCSARSTKLHELSKNKKSSFIASFLGKTVTVLFETEISEGIYSGLTDEYIRVECKSSYNLKNTMKTVRVENVFEDHCSGLLIEHS